MEIFPTTTVAELSVMFQETLLNSIPIIIGVIGLAVGIAFVTRWFGKATKSVYTDYDGDGNLREYSGRVKW